MHVFDQTTGDGTPYRASSNGSSFDISKDFCANDYEKTSGLILFGGDVIQNQISCKPHVGNVGNWYSWFTGAAGVIVRNDNSKDSICPSGWRLTVNLTTDKRSFGHLFATIYNIYSGGDELIRAQPLSFVRGGNYNGATSLYGRGLRGYYWSSRLSSDDNQAYSLYFASDILNTQNYYGSKGYNGNSLRRVRRIRISLCRGKSVHEKCSSVLGFYRGEFVRFWQKESLGEYGSGWRWDGEHNHSIDQSIVTEKLSNGSVVIEEYPVRYTNLTSTSVPIINNTWINYGTATSKQSSDNCRIEKTSSQILASGSIMTNQISCIPHSLNAGNYYNNTISNVSEYQYSLCACGWTLPNNQKDYSNLLENYGIIYYADNKTNQDTAIINLPFSLIRNGYYGSSGFFGDRGSGARYMMSISVFSFSAGKLGTQSETYSYNGDSLRCVGIYIEQNNPSSRIF